MAPDLSPTEQRIIEYLREGLHDAEIAVRLSLPVHEVKLRISRLLQRERLLDREALVAWAAEEPRDEPPPLASNDPPRGRWPAVIVGGAACLALVALAGAALLGGDREPPEMPGQDDSILPPALASARATLGARLQTAGAAIVVTPAPASPTPVPFTTHFDLPVDIAFYRLEPSADGFALLSEYSDSSPGSTGLLLSESISPTFRVHFDPGTDRVAFVRELVDADSGQRTFDGVIVDAAAPGRSQPFEFPQGHPPRFFAGDRLAIGPGYATPLGWRLLNPADGSLESIDPPDLESLPLAGWVPGIGLVWPRPSGLFTDSEGAPLFFIHHEGRALDAVTALVYNPLENLDTSTVDDEADQRGVLGPVQKGMVAVEWWSGDERFVSVASLASGAPLFTYAAEFTPLSAVRLGFAGNFCVGGDCAAAVLGIDGRIRWYPQVGTIAWARPGPFATVRAGHCAVVVHQPGETEPQDACQPEGRLLRLFVGTEDGERWMVHTRVVDGREFVRLVEPGGGAAWVAAEAVDYAGEYLFGGN